MKSAASKALLDQLEGKDVADLARTNLRLFSDSLFIFEGTQAFLDIYHTPYYMVMLCICLTFPLSFE